MAEATASLTETDQETIHASSSATKTTVEAVVATTTQCQGTIVAEMVVSQGSHYPHVFELDEDITVDEFQKLLDESKALVLSHIKNIEKDNE